MAEHVCALFADPGEASALLSEGFCPCCRARLDRVTWDVQTVPEALPGEVNVGECLPCGWTYSVVDRNYGDWLAAGWTTADEEHAAGHDRPQVVAG